ncbi:hypothetical protein ACFU8W_49235 [Streptomyces sp. NPDC057565]|uniref:hypothetical protein n=1 Tax=Streptomyces sp. NPDC057565 TaxID=3346169 RepID=UPI0036A1615C
MRDVRELRLGPTVQVGATTKSPPAFLGARGAVVLTSPTALLAASVAAEGPAHRRRLPAAHGAPG